MSRKGWLRPLRERRDAYAAMRKRLYRERRQAGTQVTQEKDIVRMRTTADALTAGMPSGRGLMDLFRGRR
jgi:hypothetical protein